MVSHERRLAEWQAAANGELEVHVWRGNESPWMKTTIVKPGTDVDTDSGYGADFDRQMGILYDGVMSLEEVTARLEVLIAGQAATDIPLQVAA